MKLFKRKDVRTEFLPSAIEIVETPASPIGKFSVWAIFLVVFAALLWSIFSKVDEVAIARGKVIPSGNTNIVGSITGGVIKTLNVKEGQEVSEGETLLTLDDKLLNGEKSKLQNELEALETSKNILTAYKNGEKPVIDSEKLNISKDLIKEQLGLSSTIDSLYSNRLDSTNIEVDNAKESVQTDQEKLNELQAKLNKAKEELQALKNAKPEKDTAPDAADATNNLKGAEISQKQSEVTGYENSIKTMNDSIESKQDALKMKENAKESLTLNYKQELEKELVNIIKLIESHKLDIEKMDTQIANLTIKSPVEGKIQQLAVNTIGGIVQPGAQLVHVVPKNKELIVEAMVLNKDIGFVSAGQTVEVKFDTFDFQRYGTIEGKISQISPDAVTVNNEQLYKATIELSKKDIDINGKTFSFSPGMTVTAEINTGQRRIIDFFIPGLKDIKNSFNLR